VVISAIITTKMTQERFTHTNRKHVAIGSALKSAIKNRPFLYLMLMKICEILGGRLSGGLAFYVGVFYVCQGDQSLATKIGGIGGTLGLIWNFLALPLVKPASQWIGKRGALIVGQTIGFACALIAPFITRPDHPYWQMIPGLIVTPLLVITGTIAGSILPDICDVDELATGQRREGLFTAVQGFISKLEISLAIVLVGYIVSWSHVDTKIGHRWAGLLAGKPGAFPVGETAVFELKPAKVEAVTLTGVGVEKYELFVSNESPTAGFSPVGLSEAFFARYLKIKLAAGKDITLRELRIGDQHPKLVASQPPMLIQKRLFWMVMTFGIVFTFLTLVMTILFPLTEEQMKEVRRQLDERHHAHPETAPDIDSP
jgi:Na+/melibiose symporter-like transporter